MILQFPILSANIHQHKKRKGANNIAKSEVITVTAQHRVLETLMRNTQKTLDGLIRE